MADIEIVIKLSEKDCEHIKRFGALWIKSEKGLSIVSKAILEGTILPKGHGRLIDADAYRKELRIEIPNLDYDGSLEPYEEGIYSAIMSLEDAPTIIEADKERG